MLNRTELEWLQYRSLNDRLTEEIEVLKANEIVLKNDVKMANAATEIIREELGVALQQHSSQNLELARTRQGFETDEIVVLGLKQLVNELEQQLLHLKAFTRDQALKLTSTSEDAERYEAQAIALEKVNTFYEFTNYHLTQ